MPLEAPNTARHAKENTIQSLKPSFLKLKGIMYFSYPRVMMKVKDQPHVNVPSRYVTATDNHNSCSTLGHEINVKSAVSDCSSDGTPQLFQKMFPGHLSVHFVKSLVLKNKAGKLLLVLEYAKKVNQLPILQIMY